MIATIIRIGLLRLRNNPLELVLTFVVPIVFFSIFALIFGKGIGSGKTTAVKVLFVDEDDTEISKRFLDRLRSADGLTDVSTADALAPDRIDVAAADMTEAIARGVVRDGNAKVAIVVPEGFGESLRFADGAPRVNLLGDSSDEIASQLAEAIVRSALGREAGEIQREKAKKRLKLLSEQARRRVGKLPEEPIAANSEENIVMEDVLAGGKVNPRISMYAAGIAVLFVLFSASGAGATLLEEQETGTLERLLSSQLSVSQLLAGKWMFIAGIGLIQLIVMFAWAQLIFGVAFLSHLPGFFVMAGATTAAAASLAILLATICRSRTQLNGVALIVVLTMSALGGSMVPRYIMSEEMQRAGLITFNAWALEGFEKVFWRDMPVTTLWQPVAVLLSASVAMMVIARVLARRWEP